MFKCYKMNKSLLFAQFIDTFIQLFLMQSVSFRAIDYQLLLANLLDLAPGTLYYVSNRHKLPRC